MPGVTGGASWSGAVFDPESQRLYVPSVTAPCVLSLSVGPGPLPSGTSPRTPPLVGAYSFPAGPRRLPLTRPPYGRITAINLATGDHDWMVPLGDGPRDHPDLLPLHLPRLGWPLRGHLLVTRTLLLAAQEGVIQRARPSDRLNAIVPDQYAPLDPGLMAFDKETGALIGTVPLPRNVHGALITYRIDGKQYIVAPVGGATEPAELVALALP